ncbi:MAG: hypothetical protein HQM08_24575 [Candidatus Riflebacteria bacterium]|nr:hypothetical protein [Candidatus Riflebacteria bacterium]
MSSLRINQNVVAYRAWVALDQNQTELTKSIQKISTGLRINSGADDPAGLSMSERLRSQIRGLSHAYSNAQDGISLMQTADSSLNETHSILQRMQELAVEASSDTLTSTDRFGIQQEIEQLKQDINRIAISTDYNTRILLNGSQASLTATDAPSARGISSGFVSGSGTWQVSIALLSGGVSQLQRSQVFLLTAGNTFALGSTQLKNISQFYNSTGTFVLDTAKTLTLYGNARSATVNVNSGLTLDQLAASIQNAITDPNGLGLNNSTFQYIGTAQTQLAGIGGYLQYESGSIGSSGDLSIQGNSDLLSSMGIYTTRQSINSLFELTAVDRNGNTNKISTDSNRVNGLIKGVDILFNSQPAQIAGTTGLESGLYISANNSFVLSTSAGVQNITVTAGDYSMAGIARDINAQISSSSTISGLSAEINNGGIRFVYTPSGANSSTINVSLASSAATLGFSNGSFSGFVDASKNTTNLVAGFSSFVGTNPDDEYFTVGDGLNSLTLLAYTTTTAANSGDLVRFSDFQTNVNSQLNDAGIGVRLDSTGNTIAFTSLRVGTENSDSSGPIASMVSLSVPTDATSRFGLISKSTSGSGQKNFFLNVVDSHPQLQIGSEDGQKMPFFIGEMSTDSLGISNLDLTTIEAAGKAITKVDQAIDLASSERARVGAYQNRLEYLLNDLKDQQTNITDAESQIRDVDIAQEMINFTRDQIISQASQAMLAQANLLPSRVVSLLTNL